MRRIFAVCLFLLFSLQMSVLAVEITPQLDFSGSIGWDMGQVVKGRYQTLTYDHVWINNNVGTLFLKATPTERLTLKLGFLGRVWYNTFPQMTIKEYNAGSDRYLAFDLKEAEGIFSIVKSDAFNLDAALGVMQYKYNDQASDLGEYLFRTGTYPAYILTNFDDAAATLSGARLGARYNGGAIGLRGDLLVLTESQIRPFYDFTIAAVVGANFNKLIDIGGGISFAHAISVNSQLTTRDDLADFTRYVTAKGDTGYYTFAGTKLMARATVDPFFALRESGFGKVFGPNAGKVYGEVAVLGVKDYPANGAFDDMGNPTGTNPYGYDSLITKMPMMVGINLPLPFVDVCSFEAEYFGSKYPNDYSLVFQKGWPLPTQGILGSSEYNPKTYRNDNWKWSLYMKKRFGDHFELVGQVGRDHQRWEAAVAHMRNYDFEDALVNPDQWAWHLKAQFMY
jgi:hypothetical protein